MANLDPRIGQLMRNGKIVHYAFVNGYDKPEFAGTLEEVEVALGLRKPAVSRKAKASQEDRDYLVHIEKKYPAWNEKGGFDLEVKAQNAKEAVKLARREMDMQCMFGRMDGPVSYKARRAS